MDTRFLESFVTVIEMGSIAAAARTLSLTPAAVAQRLHALEDEIGKRLFSRAGRNVRPTAAAIEILERTRKLLRDLRDIKAIANADVPAGELRLGAISTTLGSLTPDIIQAMAEHRPQVEIFILPGVSAELYQQVLKDELDAAIIVKPQFAIPKSCEWKNLRVQPLVALTPTDTKTRDVHRTLSESPFVLYDAAQWGGQVVSRYLRKSGIRPRIRFRLDSLESISALVERGLGVALVPNWMHAWSQGIAVHSLPIRDETTDRVIGVLWRRASPRLNLVKAFLEAARGLAERRVSRAPNRGKSG